MIISVINRCFTDNWLNENYKGVIFSAGSIAQVITMLGKSLRATIKSKVDEVKRRWRRASTLGKIKMCLFIILCFHFSHFAQWRVFQSLTLIITLSRFFCLPLLTELCTIRQIIRQMSR